MTSMGAIFGAERIKREIRQLEDELTVGNYFELMPRINEMKVKVIELERI